MLWNDIQWLLAAIENGYPVVEGPRVLEHRDDVAEAPVRQPRAPTYPPAQRVDAVADDVEEFEPAEPLEELEHVEPLEEWMTFEQNRIDI